MKLNDLQAAILYEDDSLLVVDKPAGLLVHPVAEDSQALSLLLIQINPNYRPAHRLDRETSGCLIAGKNKKTLRWLGLCFMRQTIQKLYHARVSSLPVEAEGEINHPLLKVNARMISHPDGARAHTLWKKTQDGLLALTPLTGRTHQLRAHLALIGSPIDGDPFYGGALAPRLMLHASRIQLPGLPLVEAPLPGVFSG